MKLIALDTSTKFLCLGLYDNGKIYEYRLEVGIKLSSLLVPIIKRVIESLQWDLKDVDYFACGLGPGSFTGVRVGLATIKGFAWSLRKPVVGVCTLDIMAKALSVEQAIVVPLIDAKRSLLYASIYKVKGPRLSRVSKYMLMPYDELISKVKADSALRQRPLIHCCGDALTIYSDALIKDLQGVKLLDKDYWYPQPRYLVALALELIAKRKYKSAFEVTPMYLYPKECQIHGHKKKKV